MSLHRGIDGAEPLERLSGPNEIRRTVRSTRMAAGTLACPRCDAPVAPPAGRVAVGEPLDCPVCLHAGTVRDFLSLAEPPRPAHVGVHVVLR